MKESEERRRNVVELMGSHVLNVLMKIGNMDDDPLSSL